ncbi:hypothetical protein Tco_1281542 [Tanacetum coccineum]
MLVATWIGKAPQSEYVAAAGCCANILWMKSQLIDYDIIYEKVELEETYVLPLLEMLLGHNTYLTQVEAADSNGVKVDYAKLIWEDIIHKLNKKTREKVVPYLRFISLLLEYMMPEYNNEELTINPTQVFSVHNWALKPNQTEGPPFTNRMKAIYNLDAHHELSKLLASHNFASCLPTELKELSSKFIELSREIKELKQHVKDMEIDLPGDLKEIPTKLETFTSTISSLTSQVAKLKNIQWELPADLQALPVLVSLVSLLSLLNKVTETLNKFANVVENASEATTKDVPSAGQATPSPAEGEKNTKDAETNLKDELVDYGHNVWLSP